MKYQVLLFLDFNYLFNKISKSMSGNALLNKILLLGCFVMLAACASSKKSTIINNDAPTVATAKDGSSKENAISVKSIDAEYLWIRQNYPGSKVIKQALLRDGKKSYDKLIFVTSAGETKEIYFDITSFFGKF
jgi:hypothetical protein